MRPSFNSCCFLLSLTGTYGTNLSCSSSLPLVSESLRVLFGGSAILHGRGCSEFELFRLDVICFLLVDNSKGQPLS
uniref:Putative secreted protein n=1 Tax=Anopheles marajoara TaxID=58244 RepID=A0A2M4CCP3_9DIPT